MGKNGEAILLPSFYEPVVTSFTFRQTCVMVGSTADMPYNFKIDQPNISMSPVRGDIVETVEKADKKQRLMSIHVGALAPSRLDSSIQPNKTKEVSPPPLALRKFRSKSKGDAFDIIHSDNSISAKRLKYPQLCEIDELLVKKNKPVSRALA